MGLPGGLVTRGRYRSRLLWYIAAPVAIQCSRGPQGGLPGARNAGALLVPLALEHRCSRCEKKDSGTKPMN